MRFTVNVYPARGHAIGNGGYGASRGSDLGTQLNRSERDRCDRKRAEALNEILAKLNLDRFIHPVEELLVEAEPMLEVERREAA